MNEPTGTQYGGFWIRFVALLADSAILWLFSLVVLLGAAVALGPELLPPLFIAVWVLSFLYFPVMHASGRQATFGKAIVGLKVARLHGGRISILRSLGREVAKILSGAVLMVGYIMAAFTPRKQGLHDLVSATYVMREGPARVIAAIAVIVAGFVLPFVAVPVLLGDAAMAMVTNAAQSMVAEHDPMKQAPRPAATKSAPKPPAPVQVAKAPAPAPAPAPEQKAPVPVAAAPAAAPAPAQPVKPEPAKAEVAKVEPPKPAAPVVAEEKPAVAKPAAKAAPKPGPTRIVEVPRKPAAPPAIAPKVASAAKPAPVILKEASGPKFNDLMTAVLYRDADGINELLKLGKWPDKRDSRGATPLMRAVELGDAHTAEALLRGGANPHFAMPVAEERGNGEMILLLKRYSPR